jgi:membrane protease YdiL (CAAX protease family)
MSQLKHHASPPPVSNEMANRDPSLPIDEISTRWVTVWLFIGAFLASLVNGVRDQTYTMADDWTVLVVQGMLAGRMFRQRLRYKVDLRALLGPVPRTLREALPVLAGPSFVVLAGGFQLAARVLVDLYPPLSSAVDSATPGHVLPIHSPARVVLAVVMVTVVVPIVEELFFRGFLLNRWSRQVGPRMGGILSACAFALLHSQIVWALCLAFILTAIYRGTGRLWLSIGAHSLCNAAAIAWTMVPCTLGDTTCTVTEPWAGVLGAIGAFALGAIGIIVAFAPLRANARMAGSGN